jgi:CheY-like chemotaxis protein
VVTDARMPGMQGSRLIARIRAMRPEMPAILVSGNIPDAETDHATVFLTKPVSPGILTRELRRLLCARM